jgi:PEP-CTERM motif-containing protein
MNLRSQTGPTFASKRVLRMTIKALRVFVCVAVVSGCAGRASAVTYFSETFNTDTSGSWTKNAAPAANASTQIAEFAFDYSTFGIPAPPGSGDTLGLRLRANVPPDTSRPAGVLSGLSMSPTGLSLPASYQMTVYAWSNFFGAPNASGLADNGASEGGTANVMFAAGTSGTVPVVVGNTTLVSGGSMDGIGFATTGDGGITNDYRVYPKSGTIVPGTNAAVYAAASNANTNAYYTAIPSLGAHSAPAEQQGIADFEYGVDAFPVMAGMTQAGAFGFAWHKVVITKNAGLVSWSIDDVPIAVYNASALILGGNNIALGVSDVNTSTARHPSLVFTVFDNLSVTDIPVGPGDFNNDGKVNAIDYTVWRDHLGDPSESSLNGHGNGSNGVDLADFYLWESYFGISSGGGGLSGNAAPEPSSLMLLVLGAICLLRRARSRS